MNTTDGLRRMAEAGPHAPAPAAAFRLFPTTSPQTPPPPLRRNRIDLPLTFESALHPQNKCAPQATFRLRGTALFALNFPHSSSPTNSLSLLAICALSRMMMEECICETRDSERSSVAPISFIVISS
jgi:hypothetical protein